jgi:hypothetical protein
MAVLIAFPAPALTAIAYGFRWLLVPAKKPKEVEKIQPEPP